MIPPGWTLDDVAAATWARAMAGCPQDAEYHAEGDVWTHTQLVLAALDSAANHIVRGAALLHDVAKPACTRVDGGRITSPGHSRRGAILARRLLWESDWPSAEREAVCALIRWHQLPFFAIERGDSARLAHSISQTARCDWLAQLAEADARGRICRDLPRLLDHIALFRELARDEACLDEPRAFPSDHSRFEYFRTPGRDPNYLAYDDTRCEVTLLSGLPGAGKDHWIRAHMADVPVISLDDIRTELDHSPDSGSQGAVVSEARRRAREHLRNARSFVWNATNLSRDLRAQVIDLAGAYRARVRIVYVEAPPAVLRARNRERDRPVPDAVIDRLLDRWEPPDLTEAHGVEWHCYPNLE